MTTHGTGEHVSAARPVISYNFLIFVPQRKDIASTEYVPIRMMDTQHVLISITADIVVKRDN